MTPRRRTSSHSALHELGEQLVRLSRSTEGMRLAARLSAAGVGAGDGADLLDLLSDRGAEGTPTVRLSEWLAAEAPSDDAASLALLWVLRKDLRSMGARLARSAHIDADEAEADMLAIAWEALTRCPPPTRAERLDVVWNDVRRTYGLRRPCPVEVGPLRDAVDSPAAEQVFLESWPDLLNAAAAAGVLTHEEILIVSLTRMAGQSLTDVAWALGRPYDAVRMARRTAERALAVFARRYYSEGS